MIATALYCAVLCYAGAAALAATPVARPIGAPVRAVLTVLAIGVVLHAAAIVGATRVSGQLPLAGLGPALSFAALALATALLVVEYATREVTLTLVAAPLAALATAAAAILGVGASPSALPTGVRGAWLAAHIALSFAGIAAFGTAAAAGSMYLVERHQLRSRRFTSVFRLFPPLETLDRVNHVGAIAAWLGLSAGVALAVSYSATYGAADIPQIVWGVGAWIAATALALGRLIGGWRARRAAVIASVAFALILASYVAARAMAARPGQFL
ncbi:MAG TPA: cytochrome c biogenesis protein CcsA [Gemmatimonadaceae bacterium]|nr:cytochrome c biogenesis protein CcsA [Gemmatimonadaceae bacterium]